MYLLTYIVKMSSIASCCRVSLFHYIFTGSTGADSTLPVLRARRPGIRYLTVFATQH